VKHRYLAIVGGAGLTLLSACGVSSQDQNASFGTAFSSSAADDADSDTSGAEGGSADAAETSETGDDGSPENETSTSTGDGDGDGGSTSDTGGPTGQQPESGMYAHCLDVAECGGFPVCLQISDGNGEVVDGICTVPFCEDPVIDCDPAPGGTAQAACIAVGNENDCVLDCAGGKTCPGGMICWDVGVGMICA
jgi:hypothetical protein